MRDYVILAIVLLSAPVALFSPYYGVLVWSWIAYFNPHRYGWGAAHDTPVALIIAIPTLAGAIFAPKNSRIFIRETVLLLGLWIWFALTTYYISTIPSFSGHVAEAVAHLEGVSKILLMTFIGILLVSSKEKLRVLVLVIIASFGFRALFAALFFIKTGGQYKIWGPEGTFLEDNNDFALALNMTVPMFFFIAQVESRKWVRVTIRILLGCVVISIIGTYSRGGLLGLAIVTLAIILKSRRKAVTLALVTVGLVCLLTFSTDRWKDRMGDFMHGDLDDSAESRLTIWKAGWNLAREYPITGGGFDVYTDPAVFSQYIPKEAQAASGLRGPHSIYFQMLGEQGFVGTTLFIALLAASYGACRRLRKKSLRYSTQEWAVPYTHMFEVTLLAYMSSGATLGRAYFDFFYQVIACVIILKILWLRGVRMAEDEHHEEYTQAEELAAA
jgi:probable O-glycosylation ligase (exosortase A-associated)